MAYFLYDYLKIISMKQYLYDFWEENCLSTVLMEQLNVENLITDEHSNVKCSKNGFFLHTVSTNYLLACIS